MSPLKPNQAISSEKELPKVTWQPLHDEVYNELRTALMEARFEPGAQLRMRAVAKMLGVSVMPVRAAFLRLKAEKAVEQAANGTTVVPRLSRAEFEEITLLRENLEGLAAEKAAELASEQDLVTLTELADEITKTAKDQDKERYFKASKNFKFAVVAAARAPVLFDLVESLWIRIGPLMYNFSSNFEVQLKIDRQHDVVEAIRKGDGKAARKAMARDIADGAKFLRTTAAFDEK